MQQVGKIGIGITTYNRYETFKQTYSEILKYAPEGSKIVVVDDCSTVPVKEATVRFDVNKGAASAKNKCFELLEDCDHIFLFDDDCYPKSYNWWKPYVYSKHVHLNFTFKYQKNLINGVMVSDNPNGCMMYFKRKALDVVGGFDTSFGKYGYWHASMSCRIYNAELTPFPFMDVKGSEKLFVSLDEEKKVTTSRPDRNNYLKAAKEKYMSKLGSREYIEYRETKKEVKVWYSNPYSTDKNIGKALNEFCATVPATDWICLQDGDMMYLTPDWGVQIDQVIKKYGDKYSLFGCVTNRLGRDIQRHNKEFSNNHDMQHHFKLAEEIKSKHWCEVEDITNRKYIAGMFMLFPKTLWNKIKFKENSPAFDDYFSKEVVKKGGKLGLMKGLYVYHLYRIWSNTPAKEKSHLI